MSEVVDLRRFPPVPLPLAPPDRFSQTMLAKADDCLRSAYLYQRYRGGVASQQMHRGSVVHEVARRIAQLAIDHGEPRVPPEVAKDLLVDVIEEHPELHVPHREQDGMRAMVYHLAEGIAWRPDAIVGLERTFHLDLAGVTVSGRIDLAWVHGESAGVWDYKTSFDVPTQEEFEHSFQTTLYALALAEGRFVTMGPCGRCEGRGTIGNGYHELDDLGNTYAPCPECNGRGEVVVDRDPHPIAEHVQLFELAELYPRFLWKDGVAQRVAYLTKRDLMDRRFHFEALIRKVLAAYDTGQFDPLPGTHCNYCPASHECPIPREFREGPDVVDTLELAERYAQWWFVTQQRLQAAKKRIKGFAEREQTPVRVGKDRVLEFSTTESEEIRDKAALRLAVDRAVQFGEPFEWDEHVKEKKSVRFDIRKLTPDEQAMWDNPTEGETDGTDGERGA